jgi:hypothetical protein
LDDEVDDVVHAGAGPCRGLDALDQWLRQRRLLCGAGQREHQLADQRVRCAVDLHTQ